MSSFRTGTVLSVSPWGDGISRAELDMGGGETVSGVVLESLIGNVEPGDRVIANTMALDLGLGSGGFHFILWNLSRGSLDVEGAGHMVKLRYTPLQFNFEAAEEKMSGVDIDWEGGPIAGMPVIAGSVHSQLLAAAVGYRHSRPQGKLAYVMTDGGALPAAFSNTVRFLKEESLICATITCGNAFGGDLEAVTLHGALVAARALIHADAVVAVMGPGIAGTGSPVGFTGMEQGSIVNAAGLLGGFPVVAPRITFADERERHRGLSHHTVNAIRFSACERAVIAVPAMDQPKTDIVRRQLASSGLDARHEIAIVDAAAAVKEIDDCGFRPTVMGRGTDKEPEFFMAAAAAGMLAGERGGDS